MRLKTALTLALALLLLGPAGTSAAAPDDELCDVLALLGLPCATTPPPAAQPGATPATPAQTADAERVRHTSLEPRYDPRRLTVIARAGAAPEQVDAAFARSGVTLEQRVPKLRAYMVGVAPERREAALAALRREPAIAHAEREVLVDALETVPNDSEWAQQWGLRVVGLPEVWDRTHGSSRVVVAVVDTGVDAHHPDLQGGFVPGYDFVNGDADPQDDEGHGTSVAGIVAARGGNRQGIAGVCWSCAVMPVKVIGADGSGDDTVVAAGIVWAVEHGARVVNLSLGGAGTTQLLDDAVAYAVRKGAVVVGAAGNESSTVPFFPAASPGALSVAATNAADARYGWSNFGQWIQLAAPGCNASTVRGGAYAGFCGTSSATPLVSGLAALAFAANPAATATQVADALRRTAVPVAGLARYGRVDGAALLSLLGSPSGTVRITSVVRGSVGRSAARRSYVRSVGAGAFSATLTFGRGRSLSFALVTSDADRPVVTIRGKSPLRLRRSVPSGTVAVVVSGDRRTQTPFTLALSYAPREEVGP
jgi:subtilisin family serine protease